MRRARRRRTADKSEPGRRQFMRPVRLLGAGRGPSAGASAAAALAAERKGPETGFGGIPRRPLGGTGVQVSALGVGGHHLGDFPTVDEAIRLVHEAVDAGVTFFDNCWEYYNGKTDNVLGRALGGHGEGEGHREAGEAQVERDRVRDHPRVFEQRVEPAAVAGNRGEALEGRGPRSSSRGGRRWRRPASPRAPRDRDGAAYGGSGPRRSACRATPSTPRG